MNKKHFIELADRIRSHNSLSVASGSTPFASHQIDVLANFFASQNPRFDRALWMDYIDGKCGPNGGKI